MYAGTLALYPPRSRHTGWPRCLPFMSQSAMSTALTVEDQAAGDALDTTNEPSVRHCQVCRKNVFMCADVDEALVYAREGHCVVLPGQGGSGDIFMGMAGDPFEPLTRDPQSPFAAELADTAKTGAIWAAAKPRFCLTAGILKFLNANANNNSFDADLS